MKHQFNIILLLLYVFACHTKAHAQGSNDTILVIDCELAMAYGMDEYLNLTRPDLDREKINTIAFNKYHTYNKLLVTGEDFPNVQYIGVYGSNIFGLKGITSFKELKHVDISTHLSQDLYKWRLPMHQVDLTELWKCQTITELKLSTNGSIIGISNLNNLQTLELYAEIRINELQKIKTLKSIKCSKFGSYEGILNKVLFYLESPRLFNDNEYKEYIFEAISILNIDTANYIFNNDSVALYSNTNKVLLKGYFKNGLKDSVWTYQTEIPNLLNITYKYKSDTILYVKKVGCFYLNYIEDYKPSADIPKERNYSLQEYYRLNEFDLYRENWVRIIPPNDTIRGGNLYYINISDTSVIYLQKAETGEGIVNFNFNTNINSSIGVSKPAKNISVNYYSLDTPQYSYECNTNIDSCIVKNKRKYTNNLKTDCSNINPNYEELYNLYYKNFYPLLIYLEKNTIPWEY